MSKAIPDRWLNYKPIGDRVPGTRFIAFKVPLNQHVNARVNENLRLAPESLLQSVPDLGLIIDLTNTNRYYQPSALTDHDVRHQKLMIPGKQTPSRDLAEKFCGFVADFLESNADNDKLIGVHCTHGVNRTGYLICYFMISVLNKSPEEAIKTFSSARGHKIERDNYVSSLMTLPNQQTNRQRSSTERSSANRSKKDHSNRYGYSSKPEDWRQPVRHYPGDEDVHYKSKHRDLKASTYGRWKQEPYQDPHDHPRGSRWSQHTYFRSYGRDQEEWQDRTQGYQSRERNEQSWRRYHQYQRDYPSRNYSSRNFRERNFSERNYSERNYSNQE
ncbi:RNA/RNP complex-1-interacting phosphatase homolog [Drosophila teissieri]|uniref:RNA/RNP complex-1-interacting phosphatase homolog n=1 Tax=Drosophila teissieri TaxID=7243 RepID=UPI001CBA3095|nr:RNA/RNP complex-1-interacting phosphatase homolog [Drosophila teissieri]